MSYVSEIETIPPELRAPMLRILDAFQQEMRDQLAVRREDFDQLRVAVTALTNAQKRSEDRLTRLEIAVTRLAEAQKRTERRVEELAAAQKQSEARLTRLEAAVAELAEAQQRTERRVEELAEAQKQSEARLTRLEAAVAELTEAQKQSEARLTRLEAAVAELAEAQKRTELAVQALAENQKVMGDRLAQSIGRQLESHYRDRAYAYFGRILRKTRVVSVQDLEAEIEPRLDENELEEVALLDLVVRGQVTNHPQRPDVLLAFEISSVVDRGDVARVLNRARLLRKAGFTVIPGVAGEDITRGGREAAKTAAVFVVQDGHKEFWEAAVTAALAA